MWCGRDPLREAFPELYHIARVKEGVVADFLHFRGGSVHWEVNFIRLIQD